MSDLIACVLYALLLIWLGASLRDFWRALIRAGMRKGWFRHDV